MSLVWTMSLKDAMSGPAKSATGALKLVESELKKVDKASKESSVAKAKESRGLLLLGKDEMRQQALMQKNAVRAAKEQAALIKSAEKAAAKESGHSGAITRVMGAHPGKPSKGGPLSFHAAGMEKASGALDALMAKAGATNGAIGSMLGTLGEMGPVGMAAAAALAMGTVIVGLIGGGAALALEMSEVREKSVLAFDALSKGGHGGEATLAMISRLNAVLPQSGGQLKTWAKELMAAGVTDLGQLENRIKAIASAEALMGEDGAAAAAKVAGVFEKIAFAEQTGKKLKDAGKLLKDTGATAEDVAAKLGVPVEKLNADIKAGSVSAKQFGDALSAALIEKGKGPLEAMNNSLGVMKTKLVGAFLDMFSGVDVKPFLGEMKLVSDEIQKAMGGDGKKTITGFFDTVFAMAAYAIPIVKAVFKGMSKPLGAAFKALKPLGAAITKAFGGKPGEGLITFATVLGQVLGVLVVVFAAVTAGVAMMFGGIIGAIAGFAAFASLAADAGANIAQGIADGISGNVSAVISVIQAMGSAVIAEVVRLFKIGSPSKLMAEMGGHVASGFAQGIDRHPGPEDAASNMSDGVTAVVGAGGGSGARGGGGGMSVSISGVTIQVHGSGDAKATADLVHESFASRVAQILEDMADQSGHAPAPA